MGLYKPVGGSTGPGCSLLRYDFQEKNLPSKTSYLSSGISSISKAVPMSEDA